MNVVLYTCPIVLLIRYCRDTHILVHTGTRRASSRADLIMVDYEQWSSRTCKYSECIVRANQGAVVERTRRPSYLGTFPTSFTPQPTHIISQLSYLSKKKPGTHFCVTRAEETARLAFGVPNSRSHVSPLLMRRHPSPRPLKADTRHIVTSNS
jgi:hypothetical protein